LNNTRSYDLAGELLSNVGVIGAAVFACCMFAAVRNLFLATRVSKGKANLAGSAVFAEGLLVALLVNLFLAWVAGFDFGAEYFWLVLMLTWGLIAHICAIPMTQGDPSEQRALRV
jgi:hypothetical protein